MAKILGTLLLIALAASLSGCQLTLSTNLTNGLIPPDFTGGDATQVRISESGANDFICKSEITDFYTDHPRDLGYDAEQGKYKVTIRKTDQRADRTVHLAFKCNDQWFNVFAEAEGGGDRKFLLLPRTHPVEE